MLHLEHTFDAKTLNSLALAYMGDAVFEVYVRHRLLQKGFIKPNKLQKESIKYVSAKSQCYIIKSFISSQVLTDGEMAIVKRGRNAKSHSVPKNVDVQTYKYSTAFEALLGYHYLTANIERLEDLIEKSFAIIEKGKEVFPHE